MGFLDSKKRKVFQISISGNSGALGAKTERKRIDAVGIVLEETPIAVLDV